MDTASPASEAAASVSTVMLPGMGSEVLKAKNQIKIYPLK